MCTHEQTRERSECRHRCSSDDRWIFKEHFLRLFYIFLPRSPLTLFLKNKIDVTKQNKQKTNNIKTVRVYNNVYVYYNNECDDNIQLNDNIVKLVRLHFLRARVRMRVERSIVILLLLY